MLVRKCVGEVVVFNVKCAACLLGRREGEKEQSTALRGRQEGKKNEVYGIVHNMVCTIVWLYGCVGV